MTSFLSTPLLASNSSEIVEQKDSLLREMVPFALKLVNGNGYLLKNGDLGAPTESNPCVQLRYSNSNREIGNKDANRPRWQDCISVIRRHRRLLSIFEVVSESNPSVSSGL